MVGSGGPAAFSRGEVPSGLARPPLPSRMAGSGGVRVGGGAMTALSNAYVEIACHREDDTLGAIRLLLSAVEAGCPLVLDYNPLTDKLTTVPLTDVPVMRAGAIEAIRQSLRGEVAG